MNTCDADELDVLAMHGNRTKHQQQNATEYDEHNYVFEPIPEWGSTGGK